MLEVQCKTKKLLQREQRLLRNSPVDGEIAMQISNNDHCGQIGWFYTGGVNLRNVPTSLGGRNTDC